MNHFITSAIAGVVAVAASYGTVYFTRPPQVVTINSSLSRTEITPAKARHIAATTWPEMEQREIDALTAAMKKAPHDGTSIQIFCHDESKCGDLALNLDNAFESAHWASSMHIFPNLPAGIAASSKELAAVLNAATGGRLDVTVDPERGIPGDYVAIGVRRKVP